MFCTVQIFSEIYRLIDWLIDWLSFGIRVKMADLLSVISRVPKSNLHHLPWTPLKKHFIFYKNIICFCWVMNLFLIYVMFFWSFPAETAVHRGKIWAKIGPMLSAVLAGNDPFLTKNINQDRKRFISQSKYMIFF